MLHCSSTPASRSRSVLPLLSASSVARVRRSVRCDRAVAADASLAPDLIAKVRQCDVVSVTTKETATVGSLWDVGGSDLTLLVFFTHWADLGSWELAQRLNDEASELRQAGVTTIGIGLGSASGGREFARLTAFPSSNLYADPTSACHRAMGFSPGFLASSDMNGYAKIFPMLAGIGSPGTMQEVLRGYLGDKSARPIFDDKSRLGSAFDMVGKGYQRPFELATVRLNNMVGSLSNWSKLAPVDTQQLVQQGGAVLLRGDQVLFSHSDTGILITADVNAIVAAAKAAIP